MTWDHEAELYSEHEKLKEAVRWYIEHDIDKCCLEHKFKDCQNEEIRGYAKTLLAVIDGE